MAENNNQPSKYDVVLGGNNPPPVDGLVLGSIEGVKRKFKQNSSDQETIDILKDALKYGEAGEDWLYEILATETGETQWIAAVLLSEIANKAYQKYFYQPTEKSNPHQIIGLIKKDSNEIIKKQDDLDYILKLVPTEKEKALVDYFKTIIIENLEQWNTWRSQYSEYMLYLREIDLSDRNFFGINLNLSKTNLVNANLKKANLYRANLSQSCFCQVNLSQAYLSQSNLTNVDFRKANLTQTQCGGAKFKGSNFTQANFSSASLVYTDFREVIIQKTNFYEANFRRADISGLDFKGLDIREANFVHSIRDETTFKDANFRGAHFGSHYYEPRWE